MTKPPDQASNPWRNWQCYAEYFGAPIDSPYSHSLIEIWREQCGQKIYIANPSILPPEFNVYGLWWRPFKPRWDGP